MSEFKLSDIWDDATNAVCQAMQESKMCKCKDGECIAAKIEPSAETVLHWNTRAVPDTLCEVVEANLLLNFTDQDGETTQVTITPKRLYYGSNYQVKQCQFILTAFDHGKGMECDFPLNGFRVAPGVPDVPELVTEAHLYFPKDQQGKRSVADIKKYDPAKPEFWVSDAAKQEYEIVPLVSRPQAAEIIAAKDKEINKLNVYNSSYHNQITELRELLQAAEAKNVQYEAQEPVAYIQSCDLKWLSHDNYGSITITATKSTTRTEPLYVSPAPAADLKAENEKLREALKPFADAADGRKRKDIIGAVAFSQDYLLRARDALKEISHDKG